MQYGPRSSRMIVGIHLMAVILGCLEELTGAWFSVRVYMSNCLPEYAMVDSGFVR